MFRFDKRIIYAIVAIIVVGILLRYMSNMSALLDLLISIPAVLIAITFHEFAHAFAAYKLGDDTAKIQGRMSLNPLKHLDPIGIAMLLFLGFGWGRPVEVDSRNFNRNISTKKANAIVAAAGPIANLLLAIIFSIVMVLLVKFQSAAILTNRAMYTLMKILNYTVSMNVGLGIFNLIPLPPLDGSKILSAFLPTKADMWFQNNEQIFYMIFILLWLTGIGSQICLSIHYRLVILVVKLFDYQFL